MMTVYTSRPVTKFKEMWDWDDTEQVEVSEDQPVDPCCGYRQDRQK